MPLRVRLVVILVLLVAVALALIEPITYTTTRNSLVQKVQAQMASSVSVWTQYFDYLAGVRVEPAFQSVQSDTYAALYEPSGSLVPFPATQSGGKTGNPAALQCGTCKAIPEVTAAWVRQVATSPSNDVFRSVSGTGGVSSFELLGTTTQIHTIGAFGPGGLVLVVAFPLTGVDSTMRQILVLELLIGLGILIALAAVSWFLVRLGLRPLEEMASTASEIAAGDLTRRVEDTDERTEVGQLGAALNLMLTQIERAFREREASEERLRRFVGDASHELRTPLTSIRGYAELFKDGAGGRPEDLAAALRRIESESTRMAGLVDDLLLLARLDQGRPLGHDPVDLVQLASDAIQDAGVVDPSRSIRLISTGPCEVTGDEQRLRQVLGNLINNAMAYAPPGTAIEVAIQVNQGAVDISGLPGVRALPAFGMLGWLTRTGRSFGGAEHSTIPARPLGAEDLVVGDDALQTLGMREKGSVNGRDASSEVAGGGTLTSPDSSRPVGARATIAVIDHGPGIAPEDMDHVFERFWRADQSRQRAKGGTGLGLSIVAAVVAAHGGQVAVRETPGGGATFVVELPAPTATPPPPPTATSPPPATRPPTAPATSPATAPATSPPPAPSTSPLPTTSRVGRRDVYVPTTHPERPGPGPQGASPLRSG